MTTTTAPSPADLARQVPPGVASRFGPGRTQLLAAYSKGLVDLSEPVTATLAALARAEVAGRQLVTADPGLARNNYQAAVATALRAGHDLPAADEVEDVERRARLHDIQQVAINQARQGFVDQLETALADGDQIVADHIRPALAALYDTARGLLDAHGQRLVAPAERIIGSPPTLAKAWTRFGQLAEHISTLRTVQAGLTQQTASADTSADFLVYRDDPRDRGLWGDGYGARRTATARP